jgi:hypothetical protein
MAYTISAHLPTAVNHEKPDSHIEMRNWPFPEVSDAVIDV